MDGKCRKTLRARTQLITVIVKEEVIELFNNGLKASNIHRTISVLVTVRRPQTVSGTVELMRCNFCLVTL